ncbi:metallophosphoesterase [Deinococcus rubellus]|uniref:Metallophosphoesterase n=1 Tax=Deinococcus rubellus TaxID=1889240 RepID=A0ABY5YJ66_9DEIO|nr:metallophosphoesterase [Deinococcus rubellus]UWX65147.1 metallophosphoesterase [Deinococcus rubellus]
MTVTRPPNLLPMSQTLWVVGDIHGALGKLRLLLLRAGLTDFDGSWRGGKAHLVFLGDYLDRGEDGAGVLRLVRTLQRQAPLVGGRVDALLGNHEVMFLAALLFRQKDRRDDLGFYDYWHSNGGQPRDMALIEPSDLGWLAERPAMLRVGPWLMQHADSAMYLKLGSSVPEVNARVAAKLASNDPKVWQEFLSAFAARLAFASQDGGPLIRRALDTFGSERIVHGHTPINLLLGTQGEEPGAPLPYAGRLCLDIDSAMAYIPGAGFITRLDEQGIAEVVPYPPLSFAR